MANETIITEIKEEIAKLTAMRTARTDRNNRGVDRAARMDRTSYSAQIRGLEAALEIVQKHS